MSMWDSYDEHWFDEGVECSIDDEFVQLLESKYGRRG